VQDGAPEAYRPTASLLPRAGCAGLKLPEGGVVAAMAQAAQSFDPVPNGLVLHPFPDWTPATPQAPRDIHEAIEAFKIPFRRVNDVVISREPLAEAAALAVATHEHLLVHSKPGKAKSQFARYLLSQFEGAIYEKGFTDGTLEEEVVGGIEADAFRLGIVHRKTEGTLVTADWAFLDEFTRAQRGTWDVMLGILNEGIFRNGPEIEHAHLHTAIAAANFLVATERFLAVRDRFVYQATLADEDSRRAAIRIDQVHGQPLPTIPEEQRLPLSIPRHLSAIVLGHDPKLRIELPYWLSFLKNDIIRRTTKLAHQRATRGEAIDDRLMYISSRTIAKASDSLKASALLNHRFQVTKEDLPALRYAITTIAGDAAGHSEGERLFFQALHDALHYYSEDDYHAVDDLMHIDDIFQAYRHGQPFQFHVIPVGIRNRVLILLRHHTWEDVTDQTFIDAVTHITSSKPEVLELQHEILQEIKRHGAG
jgi:hypothetical protein